MVSKRKPYKTFTREFKLEALRQLEATTRPATELARELGIRPNQRKRLVIPPSQSPIHR